MKIGEKIKQARIAQGMTQSELGAAVGVSGVAIMRYEKNLREPKLDILRKIAEQLKIPLNVLIWGENSVLPPKAETFWDKNKSEDVTIVYSGKDLEWFAFHEYLKEMGYFTDVDMTRLKNYPEEEIYVDGKLSNDARIWVVWDYRRNLRYALSTNEITTIKKSVNDFLLYSVAKLLENAEIIDNAASEE